MKSPQKKYIATHGKKTFCMGENEYIISFSRANLIGILLIIPIGVVLLGPFIYFWDYDTFSEGMQSVLKIPVILGGILAHELLHGAGWIFFTKKGIQSIRLGIKWSALTPYCHCKEPLKVKQYVIGAILPLMLLGIIPSLGGIITGKGPLFSFGLVFTWASGGDMIILYYLKKLNRNTLISDHPNKMGFIVKK